MTIKENMGFTIEPLRKEWLVEIKNTIGRDV